MIGERLAQLAAATDSAIALLRSGRRIEDVAQAVLERLSNAPAFASGMCSRNCAVNHHDFTDVGPKRARARSARGVTAYIIPEASMLARARIQVRLRRQLARYHHGNA